MADQSAKDKAYATLYQRVHMPVFFNKLASEYGIRPSSDAEKILMLENASKLRALYDRQNLQKTAARGSLLSRAGRELDEMLAKEGLANPTAASLAKQAAHEAAMDPELASAVLTLEASQRAAA